MIPPKIINNWYLSYFPTFRCWPKYCRHTRAGFLSVTTIHFIKTCDWLLHRYWLSSWPFLPFLGNMLWRLWNFDPQRKKLQNWISPFQLLCWQSTWRMQKKTALGKKSKKRNSRFSQVERSPNRSLGSNSCRKKRGLGGQMSAEIFANEGVRCRPFSTLTNKALF